ncbi:NAD(P)-binding protein [Sporormia fimetaria CBS 119925]|uniref:NAD(P)-binding protein n=1 Tax=Sporormia fimetaria CBS 119925 TaxID=1340428 RepID=A0A6A6VF69_9PLEO|nr:NAD(P)-binding protein [Sporormia fimetaria CBS 119925]
MNPSYGLSVTPTTHHTIPPSLSSQTLPTPFTVAITGAGKGLGYHISLQYAHAGASQIAISSRTASDLDALAQKIHEVNPNAKVLKTVCDTTSDSSVDALVKEVEKAFGRLDVVIANAGVISRYITDAQKDANRSKEGSTNLPIGLQEDSDWQRVLNINLHGTWRVSRAFLPLLTSTEGGMKTVVVITSLAAHSTSSLLTPIAYNVSKIAVNRLVEHIDSDHREKDGVLAYALHPGAVVTPQTKEHGGEAWKGILSDDEGLAGAVCVWLSKERRAWLSGRYVSANWDMGELEGRREEIEKGDLLKFRMAV